MDDDERDAMRHMLDALDLMGRSRERHRARAITAEDRLARFKNITAEQIQCDLALVWGRDHAIISYAAPVLTAIRVRALVEGK